MAIQLRRGIEAQTVSVRCPLALVAWLKEKAEADNRTVSNYIALLLYEKMEQEARVEQGGGG